MSSCPNSIRVPDSLACVLLAAWTLLINGIGLGTLEFFRHTEADRTLIAWEMLERGSYIVPQLLSSDILTKPPLYYWLSAWTMHLVGSSEEWAARIVSCAASVLFVLLHYLFCRAAGLSKSWSICAAAMLSTSLSFFILSQLAEIDMLFGLLTASALSAGFMAVERASLRWTILAYCFAAAAFLTKGPPVVFFYAASQVLFVLWQWRVSARIESRSLREWFFYQCYGVGAFTALICLWLFPLAAQVGWSTLGELLDIEVVQRVTQESRKARGSFYYLGTVFVAAVPWSIVWIAALLGFLYDRKRARTFLSSLSPEKKAFFLYHAIVLLSGTVMLSLASGKSTRYFFPLIASLMYVVLFFVMSLRDSPAERMLFICAKVVLPVVVLGLLVTPFVLTLDGVSQESVLLSVGGVLLAVAALYFASRKEHRLGALVSLCLLMLTLRVGQMTVFSPHRNATRSVRPIVESITAALPPGNEIYTLEMFERWINYYLKHQGVRSKRLTPARAQSLSKSRAEIFMLLSTDEEGWRIEQIRSHDSEMDLIGTYKAGKEEVALLRVSTAVLPRLHPRRLFPTNATVQ